MHAHVYMHAHVVSINTTDREAIGNSVTNKRILFVVDDMIPLEHKCYYVIKQNRDWQFGL